MAAKLARIGFRVAIVAALCVLGFYIGRPLYWKVTATLQDIREKDYTHEAVKQGITDLMRDAQNSVGWGPELEKETTEPTESKDSSQPSTKDVVDKKTGEPKASKDGSTARRLTRRFLRS